jgi:hypothetical protein
VGAEPGLVSASFKKSSASSDGTSTKLSKFTNGVVSSPSPYCFERE